ncbi:MAG: hypothetical protein Q9M35_12885 [Rhodothermus sp.]|nr:hypothetical protein [Rhodothermus sp.]
MIRALVLLLTLSSCFQEDRAKVVKIEDFSMENIDWLPVEEDTIWIDLYNFKVIQSDSLHLIANPVSGWIDKDYIYVVDDEMKSIYLYTLDGKFVRYIGGMNEGPLEFRRIVKIEKINDTTVAVLDAGKAQMYILNIQNESILYHHSFQIIGAHDFCVLNNDIYVIGNFVKSDSGKVVRAYSVTGQYYKSFGEIPDYKRDIDRYHKQMLFYHITNGKIACLKNEDLIIVAYENLPIIQAFSPNGKLVWEYRIPYFNKMVYIEFKNRGLFMSWEYDFDIMGSLNGIERGVIYQLFHHTIEEAGKRENIFVTTYYISTDGKGWVLSAPEGLSWNHEILAVNDSRVIATSDDPEPRIILAQVEWPDFLQ